MRGFIGSLLRTGLIAVAILLAGGASALHSLGSCDDHAAVAAHADGGSPAQPTGPDAGHLPGPCSDCHCSGPVLPVTTPALIVAAARPARLHPRPHPDAPVPVALGGPDRPPQIDV